VKTCYCQQITPIHTETKFVFLVHPKEARRAVATARMASQVLLNSTFIVGECFQDCRQLHNLLNAPDQNCFLLFPGESENQSCKSTLISRTIIIPDGTWHQVKKMMQQNDFLFDIPRISLSPKNLSQFKVRKQPNDQCLSTLESIAELLHTIEPHHSPEIAHRLFKPFEFMVEQQLEFENKTLSRGY